MKSNKDDVSSIRCKAKQIRNLLQDYFNECTTLAIFRFKLKVRITVVFLALVAENLFQMKDTCEAGFY